MHSLYFRLKKTTNVVRIIKASNQALVQQQNGSRMNVKAEYIFLHTNPSLCNTQPAYPFTIIPKIMFAKFGHVQMKSILMYKRQINRLKFVFIYVGH